MPSSYVVSTSPLTTEGLLGFAYDTMARESESYAAAKAMEFVALMQRERTPFVYVVALPVDPSTAMLLAFATSTTPTESPS